MEILSARNKSRLYSLSMLDGLEREVDAKRVEGSSGVRADVERDKCKAPVRK